MAELDDILKKPHSKSGFDNTKLLQLGRCVTDPLYFMQNFMKIQHPLRGAIPFKPYPFQLDLIDAFATKRFAVALTARQMGKCLQYYSSITKDGRSIFVGTLIKQSLRVSLIGFLEKLLLKLAK